MGETQINNVVNGMSNLFVNESDIEEEFKKDYGSKLRLSKGALLIQETGNQLHCSLITNIKAMVLYHRFQKLKSNEKYDTMCLAAACLNLSIKLGEDDVTLDEVILRFYHVTLDLETIVNPNRPDPPPEELKHMKENFYLIEYAVCCALSFKLKCEIAHTFAFKFLAQLFSACNVSNEMKVSMSSIVSKLLSTYYLCERCLDFKMEEIAIASLQFAYLYCGTLNSPMKCFLKKELASVSDKDRICDILDELILVSDVSTALTSV